MNLLSGEMYLFYLNPGTQNRKVALIFVHHMHILNGHIYSALMKLIVVLLVLLYGKDCIASLPPFAFIYHSGLNAN